MAGRIPQGFVDDLLSRVDIVEVIDEHVPLKRAGQDYQACCPFHQEKTPSFTVSPRKQFYHCFGCGAHGTAVGFLMQYARMDFPEAVRALAQRVGMAVPSEDGAQAAEADAAPLYRVLEGARQFFQRQLSEHPDAHRARAYLASRGLDEAAITTFSIGYAPPGWDNLVRALATTPAALAEAERAGLAVPRRGGRPYDRFRERVMFPILDRRARTVGFGGRVLDDSKPKYLNSPETPVFHKGRELYGLYQARMAQQALEGLLVVEGYMDVVALARAGITNVVGTLGTSVTPQHLEMLFRAAPRVVFCFDGDAAGRKGAWRALETSLPALREGREARFMFLPEGEDPDTLVRKVGAPHFRQEVERALPLTEYLFGELGQRVDLGTLDGRARLIDLARPLIGRLPIGALRQLVEKRLGELVRLETAEVTGVLDPSGATARPRAATSGHAGSTGTKPEQRRPSLVRRTVALLVHHPELATQVAEVPPLRELDLAGAGVLADLVDLMRGRPELSTARVLEHFRGTEVGPHLERLALAEDPALPGTDPLPELEGAFAQLGRRIYEQRFRVLQQRARQGDLNEAEKREYGELCRRLGSRS